jgi:hypothetical protein
MEANVPFAKEKEITPITIITEENSISKVLLAEMSP